MWVTKSVLQGYVAAINRVLTLRNLSPVELDIDSGGYRLVRNGGGTNVSPRLSARELYRYMQGYLDALDLR